MAKKIESKPINDKAAVASVGVWGGVISFLASAIGAIQDPAILAIIPEHVIPYVGAIGAIVGIIGRVKAKKVITSLLPKK